MAALILLPSFLIMALITYKEKRTNGHFTVNVFTIKNRIFFLRPIPETITVVLKWHIILKPLLCCSTWSGQDSTGYDRTEYKKKSSNEIFLTQCLIQVLISKLVYDQPNTFYQTRHLKLSCLFARKINIEVDVKLHYLLSWHFDVCIYLFSKESRWEIYRPVQSCLLQWRPRTWCPPTLGSGTWGTLAWAWASSSASGFLS